jgi:tetratricopeptide (TPR) repeat protein
MKLKFNPKLFLIVAALFLVARIFAAGTNDAAVVPDGGGAVTNASTPAANASPAVTRDEMANNYLQIQEQLHATQLAIEQNQEAALETSQSNALALAQRLQSLEQVVAQQRASDADAARNYADSAHKTQQSMLLMAGTLGLIGLGFMLLMVYFQWRAFAQLAQISGQQSALMANGDAIHHLAAPGRAAVDASTAQLLEVVGRLERRINELENGQKLLPEIASAKPVDLLTEGQKYLDANLPLKALECFDQFLAAQPARPDAIVKRAMALEKLGRDDEALAGYNRAIAADNALVIAHLHKGGLLNRLRRYDEALNCYEQALLGQDKKAKVS